MKSVTDIAVFGMRCETCLFVHLVNQHMTPAVVFIFHGAAQAIFSLLVPGVVATVRSDMW